MCILLLVCGCKGPIQPITLDTAGVTPSMDFSDLEFVLSRVLTDDGLLVAAALSKHADHLDAQLKRLAVTGPSASPQLLAAPYDRLAYWYNARTAWAMKLAMVEEYPLRFNRQELVDRQFTLDGKTMTLREIDDILAADADWRVLVASPGVTFRRARLPEKPFSSEDIRERIGQRLSDFIDDSKRVVIDVRRQRILFPPVLWQYRSQLIEDYQSTYGTDGANMTTALLRYVEGSAHRRLQNAVGYRQAPAESSLLLALLKD